MKALHSITFATALLTSLLLSQPMMGQTAPAPAKKTTAPKADATPAPTAQEITDAKSKGMVWVNLGTGVYHKDGEFYGKTKRGKFMTEADATKGGYRAAKEPAAKKAAPAKSKTETKK
jgi:hypothetical protein